MTNVTSCTAYRAVVALIAAAGLAVLLASTGSAVRAQDYRPVAPLEQADTPLAARLADFIELDYLGTGTENHVTSPTLFAPVIDYYGKRGMTRDAMMQDRLAYYARWPIRSYVLLPGTMRITERGSDVIDVTFNYRFEVANARKNIGGVGRTELTIRLDEGGFTILRENGEVLERY